MPLLMSYMIQAVISRFLGVFILPILILALVLGIMECFWGYRLFKPICAITGGALGFSLGAIMSMVYNGSNMGSAVLIGIILGGLLGFLSFHFCKAFFILSSVLIIILFSLSQNGGALILGLIMSIVFGILINKFFRPIVIIVTSIQGGIIIGSCFGASSANGLLIFIVSIGLIVWGMIFQFKKPDQYWVNGNIGLNVNAKKGRIEIPRKYPEENTEEITEELSL